VWQNQPGILAFMKRQDNSSHEIPSFTRYINKVFGFRVAAAGLTDARQNPDISAPSVFLAAFYAFVFRLPSFQNRTWLNLSCSDGQAATAPSVTMGCATAYAASM
jgi:hypothetical protein